MEGLLHVMDQLGSAHKAALAEIAALVAENEALREALAESDQRE